jgi:hypothetical protein
VNLNNLAGRALAAAGVHSYEPIHWYRCTGQENTGGKMRPIYAEGVLLQVQTRTASDAALNHADMVGMNDITRQFYINNIAAVDARMGSETGNVNGLARQDGKGEDMLLYRGQWWKVVAVVEDFTVMGWVQVRAVMQTVPPDFSASDV